ncbi:hypothetical protein M5K25_027688 [Dendrobium thyrsiflorum]|uniref:Uncharacterized protein n=1 Tax=Dendrobium thyrsiflorum TaxID=117978 RepID=A0ABD0TUL5_DENTH
MKREVATGEPRLKKIQSFDSFVQIEESFCMSFVRVFSVVHTCVLAEGKRGRAWEREKEACEGEFVRGSQRLLLARVRFVFSGRRPCSLKVLKVSTSTRRNGSLSTSGGSKRSDGSLPASGGSERSSGSLPHRPTGARQLLGQQIRSPLPQCGGLGSLRSLQVGRANNLQDHQSSNPVIPGNGPICPHLTLLSSHASLPFQRDKLHTFTSDPHFNWTLVNQFLQNTAAPFHNGFTSGLGKDARTIQHVL